MMSATNSDFADRTPDDTDAAVRAVEGVSGLFPAQGAIVRASERLLAAVTRSEEPASVTVSTTDEAQVVTARIAASAETSVRETAHRVADLLAARHPEATGIRVQVARIQDPGGVAWSV
jgi:hypothetical protein